jgi:hypothetical protein
MKRLDLEGTQCNVKATLHDLEATHREFEMQLEAAKTQLKCGHSRNAESSAVTVKPLKFDRSKYWKVFH